MVLARAWGLRSWIGNLLTRKMTDLWFLVYVYPNPYKIAAYDPLTGHITLDIVG